MGKKDIGTFPALCSNIGCAIKRKDNVIAILFA
jgi:hypothetical protein